MRSSPSIETSRGLYASPIWLAQQGRFHQLDVSSTMCSCMSVTPICSTGIGPSTVITFPDCTPTDVALMIATAPSPRSTCSPSGPEQAEVQPDRDQDDDTGDDRGKERRQV